MGDRLTKFDPSLASPARTVTPRGYHPRRDIFGILPMQNLRPRSASTPEGTRTVNGWRYEKLPQMCKPDTYTASLGLKTELSACVLGADGWHSNHWEVSQGRLVKRFRGRTGQQTGAGWCSQGLEGSQQQRPVGDPGGDGLGRSCWCVLRPTKAGNTTLGRASPFPPLGS